MTKKARTRALAKFIVFAVFTAAVALSIGVAKIGAGLGPDSSPPVAGAPDEPPGGSDHAIVALGTAHDKDGRVVEGYAIIHYKKGFGHKVGHKPGGKGGKDGGMEQKCFSSLARGARWRAAEPYLIDPANVRGLNQTTVRLISAASLEAWDSEVVFDIFGGEGGGVVDGVDTASPDGKNEIMFGDWPDEGAIAVTVVWGIFSGPPFMRELVEWDSLFDQSDFDWSTSGAPGRMDYQNIATHEFGHAAGMGHPDDSCTEETMYRFAAAGETKKRDVHSGDIAGINDLY